jgi:hypothetical protein
LSLKQEAVLQSLCVIATILISIQHARAPQAPAAHARNTKQKLPLRRYSFEPPPPAAAAACSSATEQ